MKTIKPTSSREILKLTSWEEFVGVTEQLTLTGTPRKTISENSLTLTCFGGPLTMNDYTSPALRFSETASI